MSLLVLVTSQGPRGQAKEVLDISERSYVACFGSAILEGDEDTNLYVSLEKLKLCFP